MIKAITFNILSPQLCNPIEFLDYSSEYLDRSFRKVRITSLINEWTSMVDQPIISLQEVPFGWKNDLEKLFFSKEYRFYCVNYGSKYNGYFGVGIGIPKFYKALKIEQLLVGEYIKNNDSEHVYELKLHQVNEFLESLKNVVDFVKETNMTETKEVLASFGDISWNNLIQSHDEFVSNSSELILEAKNRSNFTIRLLLKDERNGKKFYIYNYHMPCTFRKPIIQTLHLDALKVLMGEHMNIPTIFMTDFNLTPKSIGYNFLVNGFLPNEHKNYLKWEDHSRITMESTYKKANKMEPQFTCFSTTQNGGIFCDCLDYIFVSSHFTVLDSELLLRSVDKMPNADCPSDHLPICSTLRLD